MIRSYEHHLVSLTKAVYETRVGWPAMKIGIDWLCWLESWDWDTLLMEEIRLTTWDVWNPINNGRNYQPQLVSRISEPSTVSIVIYSQQTEVSDPVSHPTLEKEVLSLASSTISTIPSCASLLDTLKKAYVRKSIRRTFSMNTSLTPLTPRIQIYIISLSLSIYISLIFQNPPNTWWVGVWNP